MSHSRLEKLAPLSGLALVVLLILGIALTRPFDYFPTADRAVEIFSKDPARVQRGAILAGFYSAIFLLWFAGSVFGALRKRESENGRLSATAFGGGVIAAIGLALGGGIQWVAAARAGRAGGISPEAAVIMHALSLASMAYVLTIGLAAFIGATGIGSLRTRLFPAWFGWTSVLFAVGLLTPWHYIFEGLAFVWIVVASILLYQQGRQASTS